MKTPPSLGPRGRLGTVYFGDNPVMIIVRIRRIVPGSIVDPCGVDGGAAWKALVGDASPGTVVCLLTCYPTYAAVEGRIQVMGDAIEVCELLFGRRAWPRHRRPVASRERIHAGHLPGSPESPTTTVL